MLYGRRLMEGEVRREMFMELGIQSGLVELRRGTLTSSNV